MKKKPKISEKDLEWIAKVLFSVGDVGYEPSFMTYMADDGWIIRDAEHDKLPNIGHLSPGEAVECASALNRLAEYW